MGAIEASEKRVRSILGDDYVFQIPAYQRPYAWELEQVEALLDDLLDAMDQGDDEPYFLGSIVLIKQDRAPNCEVVDGQQRLTTLTMLLCVLRELITSEDAQQYLADRIRRVEEWAFEEPEVLRLRLRDIDQGFFREYVQVKGGMKGIIDGSPSTETDSQERIIENVRHLYRSVRGFDERRREDLAKFVIRRCYLVVVTTNSASSAHRIFSVMNDRGLDLLPTDILKANITGKIDERSRLEYAKKWESEEEQIGRERFVELFSHIRMIFVKEKQRRNLQDEFQEKVICDMPGDEFIDNMLKRYVRAYEEAIGRREGQVPSEVKPYLKHLSRLANKDWVPPVMQLFFKPPTERQDLICFVRGLERLAYGLLILRKNVNDRIKRYAAVVDAIQDENLERVRESLELSEDEKRSIITFLDGPVYETAQVRKLLLLRLDGLLAGSGATYEEGRVTIEHVLPQKPRKRSKWIESFPEDAERDAWTHRLANLVLLSRSRNSQASNFEFDKKKREYFRPESISPFALTMGVVKEDEWTPNVLKNRQNMLLDKLTSEWRLR